MFRGKLFRMRCKETSLETVLDIPLHSQKGPASTSLAISRKIEAGNPMSPLLVEGVIDESSMDIAEVGS